MQTEFKGSIRLTEASPQYSNGGTRLCIDLGEIPYEHRREAEQLMDECYVVDDEHPLIDVDYVDSFKQYIAGYGDGFAVDVTPRARRVMR